MTAGGTVPEQIQGRNPRYVNHEDELRQAESVLRAGAGNQVIVFGGIPGVGKTTTAVELTFRVIRDYRDGRLRARLSVGADQTGLEREVLRDWLRALGMAHDRIPDRLEALQAAFQELTAGRRLQVLLDGAVSAAQVRTLLPGDGGSLVIVTEGRPLASLVADTQATFIELSPLRDAAARDLLGRLSSAERVASEPDAVAELIGLCGHLPIALCVVGAMVNRSRARTFASMAQRLRDEHRRLAALSRDTDLSVAAAFTSALRLLSDPAQLCYRALGVPPSTGELGVEALRAALALPDYEVAEAVSELVDARLVDDVDGHESRLGVRELVRLHAEHIDNRPVAERAEDTARLLDFYHQRSVDADSQLARDRPWRRTLFPELLPTPDRPFATQEQARAWLRIERVNVRAAVELAADLGEDERVVQWCVLLWPFYEKEKLVEDLVATHVVGLAAARRLGRPDWESLIQVQLAFGLTWQRQTEQAIAGLTAAVDLARQAGSTLLEATAVETLGLAELAGGGLVRARELLRRNLDLARSIADGRRIALASLHLAKVEAAVLALPLLIEADRFFLEAGAGEIENHGKVLIWRGRMLIALAAWDKAKIALDEALVIMSSRERRFDVAEVHVALGELAEAIGDRPAVHQHAQQAKLCYESLGLHAKTEEMRVWITRLG